MGNRWHDFIPTCEVSGWLRSRGLPEPAQGAADTFKATQSDDGSFIARLRRQAGPQHPLPTPCKYRALKQLRYVDGQTGENLGYRLAGFRRTGMHRESLVLEREDFEGTVCRIDDPVFLHAKARVLLL